MDNIEFRRLVKEMRTAQKNWFELRQHQYLEQSKDLERRVDRELEENGQGQLFKE